MLREAVLRDAITQWFARISGIPDARHRVGYYPGRFEAESMQLEGYTPVAVSPWETASGGKAIECGGRESCSAVMVWNGADGWFDIAVDYFDSRDGASHFLLQRNGQTVDAWKADANRLYPGMNGNTATRRTVHKVALHHGDRLTLIGRPDGAETAAFDYLESPPSAP